MIWNFHTIVKCLLENGQKHGIIFINIFVRGWGLLAWDVE